MNNSEQSPSKIRAAFVARWLSHRFAESQWWSWDELELAAKSAGIVLWLWWRSAPVAALGIRSVKLKSAWDGGPSVWLTVEPEPEPETPKQETDAP